MHGTGTPMALTTVVLSAAFAAMHLSSFREAYWMANLMGAVLGLALAGCGGQALEPPPPTRTDDVTERYFIISPERKLKNQAVVAIKQGVDVTLFK